MLSTLIYYPVHGLAIIWGNKIIQYDLWMICLFVRCFSCLLLLYCEMVILLCSLFNVYYLLINFVHFHVTCILLYIDSYWSMFTFYPRGFVENRFLLICLCCLSTFVHFLPDLPYNTIPCRPDTGILYICVRIWNFEYTVCDMVSFTILSGLLIFNLLLVFWPSDFCT
jgi:hypothetical protein